MFKLSSLLRLILLSLLHILILKPTSSFTLLPIPSPQQTPLPHSHPPNNRYPNHLHRHETTILKSSSSWSTSRPTARAPASSKSRRVIPPGNKFVKSYTSVNNGGGAGGSGRDKDRKENDGGSSDGERRTNESGGSRKPPWAVDLSKVNPSSTSTSPKALQQQQPKTKPIKQNDTHRLALSSWKPFNPRIAVHSVSLDGQYAAFSPRELGVPEVAFVGRSNVGKSSLMNVLISETSSSSSSPSSSSSSSSSKTTTAVVSKTPGSTSSINVYTLNNKHKSPLLSFADLPGTGYAKLSKTSKIEIQNALSKYFKRRKSLCLVLYLVDVRRVPNDEDRSVVEGMIDRGLNVVILVTKVDKVGVGELGKCLEVIQKGFGLSSSSDSNSYEEEETDNAGALLCVSSVTGEGAKDVWNVIMERAEGLARTVSGLSDDFDFDDDDDVGESERNVSEGGVNDTALNESEDDDIEYSQGYDWANGDTVMLEDEVTRQSQSQSDANSIDTDGDNGDKGKRKHDDYDNDNERKREGMLSVEDKITFEDAVKELKRREKNGERF